MEQNCNYYYSEASSTEKRKGPVLTGMENSRVTLASTGKTTTTYSDGVMKGTFHSTRVALKKK